MPLLTVDTTSLNPDRYILLTDISGNVEYLQLIISFKCAETEKIWHRTGSRKLLGNIQQKALYKMQLIDAAVRVDQLRIPPGNRLEPLKGDRRGQYSIRINDQWRICFSWGEGNAHDVEIVDCY